MDSDEREGAEFQEGTALDGDAQGYERVVDDRAAIAVGAVLPWAGNLQVFELFESGHGADKGGDVGGGVEEGRVLSHEEIGDFPASISRSAKACGRRVVLCGAVGGVFKGDFVAHVVYERGKKGLGAVTHGEGEGLDVRADALECCHASGLGEGAGAKGNRDIFEKEWRAANTKIMAC